MSRVSKLMLRFAQWPAEDQKRWEAAFKSGDRFDDSGRGAHLAASTRQARRESYGRFLRFIAANHQGLLTRSPDERIDRGIVAEYVAWRRRSCGDVTVAIDLDNLRGSLKLICPDTEWSWLLTITRRIAATAPRKAAKYHLVTSDRLYGLGIDLMNHAVDDSDAAQRVRKTHAFQYRDGLIIAFLALIPLRRRTLAALRIGRHLVKVGDLWELDIPAGDTKTRRPLDYPISKELSAHIDLYLARFRCRIPNADKHASLWSSNQGRPMCPVAIGATVHKRTKAAFGFGVNLHRFRHAAASFWSIHDPVNVQGSKDLLGHASFTMTEKHYIMAQSRIAGRALAHAVDMLRRPAGS
jgi:integrase/recombinase XerD